MIQKMSINDKLVLAGLYFCAIVNVLSPSLNIVALYIVIPLLFCLSLCVNGFNLNTNAHTNKILLLYLWCCISFLWAKYPDAASRELHQILGCFLMVFLLSVYGKRINLIPWLYLTFFIVLLNCLIYAGTNNLIQEITPSSGERLNDEVLDANTFSYYCVYCTFLFYIISETIKNRFARRCSSLMFLLMLPFTFIMALLTASRQILILEIPLFVALMYLKYIFHSSLQRKVSFIFLFILVLGYSAPYVLNIFYDSFLYERMQIDLADDSRTMLLKDAFKVGLEHFPLGVGTGNYIEYSFNKHISHNTFTETWANLGIIGFLLFCSLILGFIRKQIVYYKSTHDKVFLAFGVFGLIFCMQQIFFSFYTGIWLMGFFSLVATHSETYYKNSFLKE